MLEKLTKLQALTACAIGVAGLYPSVGMAFDEQDEGIKLEEIVVTATRHSKSLQEVPMSISAVTGDMLEKQGLDNVLDYSHSVPGLEYTETIFGQRNGVNMTIRGISNSRLLSSTADVTAALTTGFYVDDVAMAPVDPKLFDVNRVEVLKGPQGTLFGQASMGGTVRVIMNKPDQQEFLGKAIISASTTKGGAESYSGDAMINAPLVEDILAVRATISYRSDGGWIDHRPASLDPSVPRGVERAGQSGVIADANKGTAISARISVLLTPNDRLSIMPSILWQSRETDVDNFFDRNDSGDLFQERFLKEPRSEEFFVVSNTIEYEFEAVTFVSVTAATSRKFNGTNDATMALANAVGFNADGTIPSRNGFHMDYYTKSFSQEIRLQGNYEFSDDGSADWVVGGTYMDEDMDNVWLWDAPDWNRNADNGNTISNPAGIFVVAYDTAGYENISLFADVTFNFGNLSIGGGIRYYDQELISNRTITGSAFGDVVIVDPTTTVQESGTTLRGNISYDVSDDVLAYVSYAEGFRLGGPGLGGTLERAECVDAMQKAGLTAEDALGFDSDKVASYEAGIKATIQDRTKVNLAVFQMDWTGLQQTIGLFNFNSGCDSLITTNIGAARSKGFELAVDTIVGDNLTVGATASYVDIKIVDAPVGLPISEGDAIGGVPKWTLSAYVDHEHDLLSGFVGNVRVDWSYRDKMLDVLYVDSNNPFTQLGAYQMVNFKYTIQSPKGWSLVFFANNLLNKIGELGGSEVFGESSINKVQITRPRTVGFKWMMDF